MNGDVTAKAEAQPKTLPDSARHHIPLRIRRKIRFEQFDNCPVPGPCWMWTGYCNNNGYASVTFGGSNDRRWFLHRYTYTVLVGEIPPELQLDHLCRNRRCCNPRHLEPVTNKVNALRGILAQQTHCRRGGHALAGHNLIVRKNGRRQCRTCLYDGQRRSIARRRAKGLPDGHRLHGTSTGYKAYACRCEPCRAAGAAEWQKNPNSAAGKRARRHAAAA